MWSYLVMKNRIRKRIYILVLLLICINIIYCYINNVGRTQIGESASIRLEDEWCIEVIEQKKYYSYISFGYQEQEVATMELSVLANDSLLNKNTSAESFVRVYLGMHAEMKQSEKFTLDTKKNILTKVCVNRGLSAAETENGMAQPTDEKWYFGISSDNVCVCVQLKDLSQEDAFEKILRTLQY